MRRNAARCRMSSPAFASIGRWRRRARLLETNAERHLKSAEEMTRLFGEASKAIGQTTRFFKRCKFSLDELKPHYPSEFRHGYATAA